MSEKQPSEITQILQDWNDGNGDAKERLMPFVYDELKCQARILMSRERGNHAPKAVEICQSTIEFPTNALKKEPENGVVAFDLAISHFNLARAYRLAEKYPQTIEESEKASAVMLKLSEKTPDNLEYKRNLAVYDTEKSRAFLKLKQPDKALVTLQKVIEIIIPIVEADKKTTTNQYDLAIAFRLSANANFQKNNKPKATEFIEKAIAIVQKLKELNSLRDADKNLLTELEKEKSLYAE